MQSLVLKIKGLYTSQNELAEVPEGALLEADNIDISKDSIAEPRRGFDRLATAFSDLTQRAAKTWFYKSKQFAHHGTLGSENTISYLDGGAWHSVGTFSAPTGYKVRTLEANQNLYATTSTGIQKLDAYNGTATLAGAYKGLDVQAAVSASASTWLTNNYRTAYKVVWGIKDANGNLVRGAPSARESFKNTAGSTKAVDVTTTIPSGVTTAWFYQLYRAAAVDNTAADIEPSEEMGLVFEGNPTAGEITAGKVTITDIVPDALRGETLYTSPSQEGIAYQNERPPLAKDIATFRDVTFYLNTVSKHRYYLTVLSVGSPNGVQNDDTLVIGGITYTGKAAETIASAQFKVVTGGSASQNIRDTALSLVRVINRYASSTVYAVYLSGPDDLPGKILLEERGIGGSSFAVTGSRATSWNPALPSSGTAESSTNDTFVNGLAWSKEGQPEAVPLGNFKEVGTKSFEGYRIIPLKEALYIFKADGIYRLTGYYPNFTIELLDSSAKLIAPESPAVLNNQIYALTDQGVTVISDGVKIISRPIEQDLLALFGASLTDVQTKSWGISYETERKYYLFTITGAGESFATQAYVYNTFTQTWVRHILSSTCGVVEANRLYLADALSAYIQKDRKSGTYLDYADFGATTSITAINGLVMSLASGADTAEIGDILYQSSTCFGLITAVDSIASTVTVLTDAGFTAAACDILKSISCNIKWAPVTTGNPAITKQYNEVIPLFKSDFQGTAYLTFSSDLSPFEESVSLEGAGLGAWGLFTWGGTPWGGQSNRRPIPQWVPRDKQRCSELIVSFQHAYGFSPWQLQGISIFGEPGSQKVSR